MARQEERLNQEVCAASNWDSRHGCGECPLGEFCLPLGLEQRDAGELDRIMQLGRPQQAGQALFRAGEPMRALYAVRAGYFKTTVVDLEGDERIVDFHLPGELIGLDAVFSGVHPSEATALSIGKVCIFPYASLMVLAAERAGVMESLLRIFGKNLLWQMEHSADSTADQRLARFLLRLSMRVPPRGEVSDRFLLPMSRSDIASHLRLANGTLSRMIARLQEHDLVRIDERAVEIIDLDGLQRHAGADGEVIL